MNVITKAEIVELMGNMVSTKDMFLVLEDVKYQLKNQKWYDKTPWYGCKILPHTDSAFDCGKKAVDLMCRMFDKYRKKELGWISSDSPGGGSYPALPFGIMKYKRQRDGEWHIINFAICGDSVETARMVFYERTRNKWMAIELYPDEKSTTDYMMVF